MEESMIQPNYKSCTLTGNYFEQRCMDELKQADFIEKSNMGGLKVNQAQALMQATLAAVELSAAENGLVKFGSTVMLSHGGDCGFLSCDANDRVPKADGTPAIAVTASANDVCCRRNAFIIERAKEIDGFDGDVLHYGQDFRLLCRSGTFDGYLHSEFITPQAASKISRNQEVCFSAAKQNTVWQCTAADSREALAVEGEPVRAFENLVLKHTATGSYLASHQEHTQANLFGQEREVCCRCAFSKNKVHALTSERDGKVTNDQQLRHNSQVNFWQITCKSS